MNNMIKLANGTEIPWDEFSKWNINKQNANTINPKKQTVETPLGIFPSISEAMLKHNTSAYALRKKLNSNEFPDYRYLNRKIEKISNRVYATGKESSTAQSVMTPLGKFYTLKEAAIALKISIDGLKIRCKSKNMPEYYLMESKLSGIARKNPGAAGINSGVARRVMTPIGEFCTVRSAQKALGISHTTLLKRLKDPDNYPDYFYL